MKPLPLILAALVVVWLVVRRAKVSKLQVALAAVVIAVLVVYGTGLVKPPNFEHLIEDIGRKLGRWTYVLVGVMTFLETGAFLSFVAPGEFTILFGGLIAGQGRINVIVLIAVVWTCAVLGDTTSFFIGRKLGRNFLLRHGERVKITDERLRQVERFYDRHGGITVFIGRFVGLLRALGPFIAGASKMPYRRFLPYDILGAGLWGSALVLLGYIFWHSFDRLKSTVGRGTFALGTLITVVVGTVWTVRWLRVPENRRKANAWLDEQERKPVARPFVRAFRGTYRRILRPLGRRVLPPTRFLWERLTPGRLGLELTTLLAIAAVGSFACIGLAMLVEGASPHQLDLDFLKRANDLRAGWALDVTKVFTSARLPAGGGRRAAGRRGRARGSRPLGRGRSAARGRDPRLRRGAHRQGRGRPPPSGVPAGRRERLELPVGARGLLDRVRRDRGRGRALAPRDGAPHGAGPRERGAGGADRAVARLPARSLPDRRGRRVGARRRVLRPLRRDRAGRHVRA